MPDLFSEQIHNSCGFALLSPLQDRIAYSKVPSLFLYVFAVVVSQSYFATFNSN